MKNTITIKKLSKTDVYADSREPVELGSTIEIAPDEFGEPDYYNAALEMAAQEYEHYAASGTDYNWAWRVELNGEEIDRYREMDLRDLNIDEAAIFDALVSRGMSEQDAEDALS
jgi:hypothetical protein